MSSAKSRVSDTPAAAVEAVTNPSPATPLDQSRLILDKKGRFMFLGDAANPSFLQSIRRLVRETQGPSPFVDDPLRPSMIEASPEGAPTWIEGQLPPTFSEEDAKHYATQYYNCTNGIVDMFDKSVLIEQLPSSIAWRAISLPLAKPLVYLVLAIGAQASSRDLGQVSDACFNYGRHLSARYLMEDPSTLTVEAYILITLYLLAASRRNAAFMHLGFAVRAAYALGLHLKSVSQRFPAEEAWHRERLWRSLRSLDILTSALLGRPPSTKETRDTAAEGGYSAVGHLLSIFEDVLVNAYEERQISAATLNRVASRQREWAAVFPRGLAVDNIDPDEFLPGNVPNTGLMHIKIVFHWTVMLLTRPFLLERVTSHARKTASGSGADSWTPAESSRILAHACLNSAIRTMVVLEPLIDNWASPKRLPFAISCTVHAALILGLSFFGDMHTVFPVDKHMHTARKLLEHFAGDPVASRNSNIIQYLHEACIAYSERRHAASMQIEGQLISSLFGDLRQSELVEEKATDWVEPAQPLSPTSLEPLPPDDFEPIIDFSTPKLTDADHLFGASDLTDVEQPDLTSLYALIDTSGGYLEYS